MRNSTPVPHYYDVTRKEFLPFQQDHQFDFILDLLFISDPIQTEKHLH